MPVKVNTKYLLFDIEGTTSSISFVKSVLFPYSAEKIQGYLEDHVKDPLLVLELRNIPGALRNPEEMDPRVAANHFRELIRKDIKDMTLKEVQGQIWKQGYETGAFKAHLYEEVAGKWREWKQKGIELGIYSSGSLQAQKLYFRHTEFGDLLPLLSHHFDLNIGGKKERSSYDKIARELNKKPQEITFFSDVRDELVAAKAAGFATVQVRRPQTPLEVFDPYVQSFNEVWV